MIDTPIQTVPDGCWSITVPAGRATVVGHALDEIDGYRVTLKFSDSRTWNSLSVEMARLVVATIRSQRLQNADAITLANEIEQWADRCERLNAGWLLMGSPRGGFDAVVHGHA
jgi:hypothetical protein